MRLAGSHRAASTRLESVDVSTHAVNGLHVSVMTPSTCHGHVLYVHGGPGSHSAYFERALQELTPYSEGNIGWICYDQRGCGRSPATPPRELTHERNLDDLSALIAEVQPRLPSPNKFLGVFGHSYGALLAYELGRRQPEATLRVILAGLSALPLQPRNRQLQIDLNLLKQQSPSAFQTHARAALMRHEGAPWQLAAEVRRLMPDASNRKLFLWGNLSAMNWYESLKSQVDIAENDDIYHAVRATVYADESGLGEIRPEDLSQPTLWINGFHDLLMGGESFDMVRHDCCRIFRGSGHYPHLEEPERFLAELRAFLLPL